MTLLQIIILALLVEATWETLKLVWQKGKASIDTIGALIVGMLIAWLTTADLFLLLGFNIKLQILGILLTGILISRGSTFVHNLFKKITELQ